ncbi:PAS domain-containing sensor histidine kinase [Castellaniella sp.]|uniref:PAS domain-containing sensor histidine kinase n=1 Tax=Castellaniella sp. TaxID=1955812 RepID=UPI002AFF827D|nr:PAS domain-containing protein [Castellaniella sp.]
MIATDLASLGPQDDSRRESERFAALARVSNTGVWEWDAGRNHLWCSPEYFSMLGLDPAAFAGQAQENLATVWLDFLHPDDREQARRSFADYLASDTTDMYESEFRMAHAGGGWVWVWSRGTTLRDEQGRSLGRTVGTHIDVTSLRQTQERLRESQDRLAAISNNLPDSMVYQVDCGPTGDTRKFTYLSEGVWHLHGVCAADALRSPELIYGQVSPDTRERLLARQRQCLADMSDFRFEICSTLPDGRQRWFLIASSPRRLDNGHLVFDGIELDITESKLREQEIRNLNASLERRVRERTVELQSTLDRLRHTQEELLQNEKLASLGALVAGVAHELNTPIGNAVTVASTLARAHRGFRAQTESGLTRSALARYLDDVEEGSQIIERNLVRAAELIGGFKQLSADQTSYQRRRFDLRVLVREVVMTMSPAVRKTRISLQDDIPDGLVLDSFPGPLGQVLMNLINNALIHAFEGRDAGLIRLVAGPSDNAGIVCLSVIDDGCGIASDDQKRIFDPFFSTRLGQGGSGLGLHITHTLVTGLLGGRIKLDSQVGQGSRFSLRLPLQAPRTEGEDRSAR